MVRCKQKKAAGKRNRAVPHRGNEKNGLGRHDMLRITVDVDAPAGQAIGIKEQIAMDLEKYGDTRVVRVEEIQPRQMEVWDGR